MVKIRQSYFHEQWAENGLVHGVVCGAADPYDPTVYTLANEYAMAEQLYCQMLGWC